MKYWLKALRLRTLPLAISAIGLGCVVAMDFDVYAFQIGLWAMITAVMLQILSNLANDYGDFLKGTDQAAGREDRALASGSIPRGQMLIALVLFAVLALGSGLKLLDFAFDRIDLRYIGFLALGFVSIAAAIQYTVGKRAYGYHALGDLAVLVFFGWIAVSGTYLLQARSWDGFALTLLPSTAFGLLSVGVLNVNNIRDIDTDLASGKRTMAGFLGKTNAESYQLLLILIAFAMAIGYMWLRTGISITFVALLPLYLLHWFIMSRLDQGNRLAYNRALKILVFMNMLWVLVFSIQVWEW
ncbi:MAG: 1,4-dihydroxy-2-naphthoate octaprenyltransferase [Flavobacteriales bacterium]|nr:1,4-dihydroxy-2-naphthoate octaprenyltransferase [Flavobacteriales bacterium]